MINQHERIIKQQDCWVIIPPSAVDFTAFIGRENGG